MTTFREYPDIEQGSDEWNDLRRGIVTASAVGQLITTGYLGADAYICPECSAEPGDLCRSKVKRAGEYGLIKTFHSARSDEAAKYRNDRGSLVVEVARNDTSRGLTMLLTAERITGYTEPTWISSDMQRGIFDEPVARDLYSQHFAPVTEVGFMVREEAGWKLGFSPDGLVGDDGLLEIKCRRNKNQLQTILAGEVPAENMAQVQAGLFVSGREWLDYVSFAGGMPLLVIRVLPDRRWFDAITAAVEQFEAAVEEVIARYTVKVDGLPMTERSIDVDMVI